MAAKGNLSAALATALMALALGGMAAPVGIAEAVDHVLITAVLYDPYTTNEGDEFVRLHNPTPATVDLSGWVLKDHQNDTLTFPAGANIAPGQDLYLTAKATDFRLDMVFDPDWEYKADTDATPNLSRQGSFTLSNSDNGDEVRLYDAEGRLVDAVAWGARTPWEGWLGDPLEDVSEGVVLERDTDEVTGLHPDTDTASDWDDTRIYVVGQSHYAPASFEASQATLFTSPDSSFDAVADFLRGADERIDIELYQVLSTHIGDVLVERVEAGVQVRVLMEGGPVGMVQQDRYQENWVLDRLQDAGAEVRFMVTNSSQDVHDRYNFLHGKLAMADGERVLAMSGNWKDTGLPKDPTYGNREWGVVVHSEGLHDYVATMFEDDWDAAHRDILPFGAGEDWRYHPPPEDFEPDTSVPSGPYAPYFPSITVEGPFTVRPILSPDTSTREFDSLRQLLREATDEVLIEQMYAHKHWGPSATGSPETHPSLYLEAAIEAARNGAKVYVLLGEEFIDDEDTRNNNETIAYLRGLAEQEGLPIQAKLVNAHIAELVKIHNKGVVVDQEAAVVSSINWGRASAQDNRELALVLEHPDIAAFYRDVFWYDWAPLTFKPVTDLTVTGLDVAQEPLGVPPYPAPLPPGDIPASPLPDPNRHRVAVTVANVGAYGAGDFDVTVIATPTLLGDPEVVLHQRVNAIAAGASLTLTQEWDTTLRLGEFELTAVVDSADEVVERDEGNNTLSATFPLLVPLPGVAGPWPMLPPA